MKIYFRIFLFVFLILSSFNSCKKKADFSDIDPNLPGKWYTLRGSNSFGSNCEFSPDAHMNFNDYGDSGSGEDDVRREGEAKIKRGIIILGESHFKIEEYPMRFDTTVLYDIYPIHTHWKMTMSREGNYGFRGNWNNSITYYKE